MSQVEVVQALNQALSMEYTAAIQYFQHGHLVRGQWRKVYSDFFSKEGEAELGHAHRLASKIVALGEVPTVELGPIAQSTDLAVMIHLDLEMERKAYEGYVRLLKLVQDDVALRVMLEGIATDEKEGMEELEKLLADPRAVADTKTRSARKTG